MAKIEMVMPKMGESVMEGTILTWLKEVGDIIEQDESVLEVATDKVDTEVPATHAGVLVEILVEEGDVVQVGAPIAIIQTEVEQGAGAAPLVSAPAANEVASTPLETESLAPTAAVVTPEPALNGNGTSAVVATRFYSPLVMNIAREEGISMSELEGIEGTGAEGRVTKNDMFSYLQSRTKEQSEGLSTPQVSAPVVSAPVVSAPATTPAATTAPAVTTTPAKPAPAPQKITPVQPAKSFSSDIEVIEMDRMRKMIAQRMVESVQTSPHVTSFIEADVTNIVNWRNKWKRIVKERDGISLTFTPIFIEAVSKAIQDFPKINCSVDGDKILLKRSINIGMAVALPNDNLIVPVIHHTNELNLLGITRKVSELVDKARNNKLSPDDLSGGTYTVSNIGSFGNMLGTPIIMQPQVAILSLGAIIKKPAVIETPQGDMIGIRHMMYLSHSYDHRVVDGALGGKMVRRVADYLENFDVERTV